MATGMVFDASSTVYRRNTSETPPASDDSTAPQKMLQHQFVMPAELSLAHRDEEGIPTQCQISGYLDGASECQDCAYC